MSVGACCDRLQVHSKDKEFSHSKYIGDFKFHENEDGDPITNNEAAVFIHSEGKRFMYRGKDGDWMIGSVIGNNKKGVFLRSQDPDRSSFIQECPCQTQSWQKMDKDSGKWISDSTIRVLIRQARVNF